MHHQFPFTHVPPSYANTNISMAISLSDIKFMFSKKATKIDEIFTVVLTVTTYCQIEGEDFVNFCGLLRKRELYLQILDINNNTIKNMARN